MILLTALSSPEQRITAAAAPTTMSRPRQHGRADGQVQRHGAQPPVVAAQILEISDPRGDAESDGRSCAQTLALIGDSTIRQRVAGRRDAGAGPEPHGAVQDRQGVFGQTPTELIQGTACEAARMLAECPELKIAEIADRVGINSLQYWQTLQGAVRLHAVGIPRGTRKSREGAPEPPAAMKAPLTSGGFCVSGEESLSVSLMLGWV